MTLILLSPINNTANITTSTQSDDPTITNHPSPSDSSKKRKTVSDPLPKPSSNHHNHHRKNHSRQISLQAGGGDAAAAVDQKVVTVKKSVGNKRSSRKSTGNNCHNGNNNTEGRWAEQLLNPCAEAIMKNDMSRVPGPTEAIGHLGSGLRPPLIKRAQIVIIYYIILYNIPSKNCIV